MKAPLDWVSDEVNFIVHIWCLISGFSHRGRANVIEQYPLLWVGPHHSLKVLNAKLCGLQGQHANGRRALQQRLCFDAVLSDYCNQAAKQELFQTTWVLIRSCCVFNANAQWGKQWRGESKASLLGNHHLLNSDCLVQVYPEHNWQWVAWQHCAIFCKVSPLSWILNTWWMSSKAREQSKPFCLGLMLDLGPYAGNLIPTPKP